MTRGAPTRTPLFKCGDPRTRCRLLIALTLAPLLLALTAALLPLTAAAMIPMVDSAGPAAAAIGTISILGGALVGAIIDISYNGTIIPLATAGVIGFAFSAGFFRWANRDWDAAVPQTDATEPTARAESQYPRSENM